MRPVLKTIGCRNGRPCKERLLLLQGARCQAGIARRRTRETPWFLIYKALCSWSSPDHVISRVSDFIVVELPLSLHSLVYNILMIDEILLTKPLRPPHQALEIEVKVADRVSARGVD
jgi:hypothetical protein